MIREIPSFLFHLVFSKTICDFCKTISHSCVAGPYWVVWFIWWQGRFINQSPVLYTVRTKYFSEMRFSSNQHRWASWLYFLRAKCVPSAKLGKPGREVIIAAQFKEYLGMQKQQSCSQGWGRKTPAWLQSAMVASPREVWGDLVVNPLWHLCRSLHMRRPVGRAVREKLCCCWQQSEGSWGKQEQQPPGLPEDSWLGPDLTSWAIICILCCSVGYRDRSTLAVC